MSKDRNYDRTEKELDLQLEGLKEIQSVFDSLNIKMFLSAGTMLGAVRDNDFIKWDWNVSVGCFSEEFNPVYKKFKKRLIINGFILKEKNKGDYICLCTYKNNIKFVIENVIIKGEWATRPYHKSPVKFIKQFEKVLLRGEYFLCPSPIEECVEWQYGKNWKTPIKVGHRDEVINPEHKIKKGEILF